MLEDQALAGLSSLALLDLSRNQLGTISREALQPLASLQVLRLTGKLFLGAKPSSLSTAEAVESRPRCGGTSNGSAREDHTITHSPERRLLKIGVLVGSPFGDPA